MQIAKRLPYYASLALLAYMPFHIFLAQSLSLVTGGLDVWKIAKDVLVALTTIAVCVLVITYKRSTQTFLLLGGATLVYIGLHLVVWVAHPHIYRESAILGSTYNVRLLCFLLIGYGAILLYPGIFQTRVIMRLAVGVAVVVAALGVVQYFLPRDILTHIGYGIDRGARANFSIDNAAGFTRVMSTLRDPNSLAAYLLVPMSAVTVVVLRNDSRRRRIAAATALSVMGVAMIMTFSRSAWMAAIITLGLTVLWRYRSFAVTFVKRFGFALVALVILGAGIAYSQRHSSFVTSYITHSSQGSTDIDSNEYHWLFVKQGIEGIVHQPLGHGPGTAGLASIQNPKGSFLTENYYVQIGYELGLIGLLVFVGMQVWIYMQLWRRRTDGILPVILLASFWGYVLMNMLLHTWSNEAVACQWWLLAGMALALPSTASDAKRS